MDNEKFAKKVGHLRPTGDLLVMQLVKLLFRPCPVYSVSVLYTSKLKQPFKLRVLVSLNSSFVVQLNFSNSVIRGNEFL